MAAEKAAVARGKVTVARVAVVRVVEATAVEARVAVKVGVGWSVAWVYKGSEEEAAPAAGKVETMESVVLAEEKEATSNLHIQSFPDRDRTGRPTLGRCWYESHTCKRIAHHPDHL